MATSDDQTSDDTPAWLDFGRILVADLVARRRADRADDDADEGGGKRSKKSDSAVSAGDEFIGELRAELHRSLDETSGFSILAANARLDPVSVDVLALALAVEVDPALHRLVGYANDLDSGSRLTIGNVMALLDGFNDGTSARHALLPSSPLMRAGLVTLVDTPSGLFAEQRVVVHKQVTWAALGDRFVDPDLPDGSRYIDTDAGGREADDGPTLTLVSGAGRIERRSSAMAHSRATRFLVSPLPDGDDGWRALVREGTITGRTVIVESLDGLPNDGRIWIERARHLEWAVTSHLELSTDVVPDRPRVDIVVDPREPSDQEWAAVLGDLPRTHRLSIDQLHAVGQILPSVGNDLDAAVRRLVGGKMDTLAQRIRPTRGWDDIVLSPEREELLRSLVDRYRFADTVYDGWGFDAQPSRGLVAAFSGPSGTGKTLATEIIAGVLGLDVYKLDLSSIVSKYIGETEKNLEEIFDAASAGNLVLFFDEADALFGKRSEVRDARDRYANIEVSYLLQRIERYDGLVILATNFEKNIDEAFLRRIHVRVEFSIPQATERTTIWERNLPSTAPLEDVDVTWLGERFEISGGSIRNAAIHAAFIAAAAGTPITMEAAVRGVAREYRKMGRLIKREAFGQWFDLVAPEGGEESAITHTALPTFVDDVSD